ncbi:molybdopterin oxidoreductase family protein [Sediminibacillus massiliensis]|uniref:molybdopterin oxidoreductase family protein n=1 Tax=Sediminibacillus massiliensis TaxID=1926277 RepID=UPI00098839C5|nr:molybdopterin oxidoreductase family protein [Sediminibacillus massiliensis]
MDRRDIRQDQVTAEGADVDKWVHSTCNLCSVGCGTDIAVKDDKIVGIRGINEHSINKGRLDPKAKYQWIPNNSEDRVLTPLIRNSAGELEPASWDEAMELVVRKSKQALKEKGGDGVSIYSTGQGFLEDYYTIGKIGRAGLKTHLLDANTRLCTATTEWCLIESFGSDGVPASFDDVDKADTIMLFGHNPAETGTVLWDRILTRKKATGKPYLIVVDPRKTPTAEEADLHLDLKPGTNLALLNCIQEQLIEHNWIDPDFIQNHTIQFDSLQKELENWSIDKASSITGLPADKINLAAEKLGKTNTLVSTTLQGAFQSSDATASCVAINNIHLMRGLIGKEGCGPLHMAGQPSSSANRTVGGVGTYPANRNPNNPTHIKEIAELWNVREEDLEIGPNKDIIKQIELIEKGQIQFFWNIHTNPLVSLPNKGRARKALEKVFLVVQDPFLTETSEVADVILPPAMWGEKEGTMENADRTINLLRKAVEPPEGVKSDFEILVDYANRMGFQDKEGNPLIGYNTPEEAFEEWKRVSEGRPSDMTGMTYERLEKENGIRWPCTKENPEGKTRLYEDFHFPTETEYCQSFGKNTFTGRPLSKEEFKEMDPDGKAMFQVTRYGGPSEAPQSEYPFWLNTGRLVWHWHTRTKTGRMPEMEEKAPQVFVEINEEDARHLSIREGDQVRIVSPRGKVEVPAKVGNKMNKGEVFVPFHYGNFEGEQTPNEMTMDEVDPLSHQPVLKHASCRLEKVG